MLMLKYYLINKENRKSIEKKIDELQESTFSNFLRFALAPMFLVIGQIGPSDFIKKLLPFIKDDFYFGLLMCAISLLIFSLSIPSVRYAFKNVRETFLNSERDEIKINKRYKDSCLYIRKIYLIKSIGEDLDDKDIVFFLLSTIDDVGEILSFLEIVNLNSTKDLEFKSLTNYEELAKNYNGILPPLEKYFDMIKVAGAEDFIPVSILKSFYRIKNKKNI